MGEKETTLKEVGEMLAYVVEHMATKDDLVAAKDELRAEMQDGFASDTCRAFRDSPRSRRAPNACGQYVRLQQRDRPCARAHCADREASRDRAADGGLMLLTYAN